MATLPDKPHKLLEYWNGHAIPRWKEQALGDVSASWEDVGKVAQIGDESGQPYEFYVLAAWQEGPLWVPLGRRPFVRWTVDFFSQLDGLSVTQADESQIALVGRYGGNPEYWILAMWNDGEGGQVWLRLDNVRESWVWWELGDESELQMLNTDLPDVNRVARCFNGGSPSYWVLAYWEDTGDGITQDWRRLDNVEPDLSFKADKYVSIVPWYQQDLTLSDMHAGCLIVWNGTDQNTLIIPSDAMENLPIGYTVSVVNAGSTEGPSVLINGANTGVMLVNVSEYAEELPVACLGTFVKIAANSWIATGGFAAGGGGVT